MKNKDFIIERDGKQFVDVVRLLPEALPSGKKILWKPVDEEKVEISVDKSSARGGNAKSIIIKRLVPINELLFEGLGLRFGDGIKLQGGLPKVFGFSNTNLELQKRFLNFAEKCFGIISNRFRIAITMPPKLSDNLSEIERNISQELNIPLENFFKTRILERRNNPIIDIKITSTLLALVLNLLFDNLQEVLFSREDFSAATLKGIIASEANISLRGKQKRLGEITIAGKEKDKRNFIRKLLLILKILPDKDKEIEGQECVLITGLSNFRKMEEWNLVSLQPFKSRDFEIGIQNFRKEEFRKGEGKFLILNSLKERPKRSIELENEFNRCQQAINWTLDKLENKNLVTRERKGKNIFWKLTENGLNLISNGVTLGELKNN